MTHQETYNALRTRLNDLIDSRLELKFGCEVELDEPENEKEMAHPDRFIAVVLRTTKDNLHLTVPSVYPEEPFEIWNDEIEFARLNVEILGTSPTLQDILLAIGKKQEYSGDWKIDTTGCFYHKNKIVFDYDLTKPVEQQSTQTLQAILDLLV